MARARVAYGLVWFFVSCSFQMVFLLPCSIGGWVGPDETNWGGGRRRRRGQLWDEKNWRPGLEILDRRGNGVSSG